MNEGQWKYAVFLFAAVVFYACNGPRDDAKEEADELPAFAGFPAKPFYDIAFNEERVVVEQKLYNRGFEKIDSSGSAYFLHRTDSMEVILPDESPVSSFKVFLRSTHYLNHKQELRERFGESAAHTSPGTDFEIYSYVLAALEFKLTLFAQPGYVRLNFEQKLPK